MNFIMSLKTLKYLCIALNFAVFYGALLTRRTLNVVIKTIIENCFNMM